MIWTFRVLNRMSFAATYEDIVILRKADSNEPSKL